MSMFVIRRELCLLQIEVLHFYRCCWFVSYKKQLCTPVFLRKYLFLTLITTQNWAVVRIEDYDLKDAIIKLTGGSEAFYYASNSA